ncbi:biotin-dependent carboxyltransferase family protein [Peribacillus sp. Hz7]|uniref:5-oxoprolinase subunit C family protein n=1 Tax=Peribacillus sp. Hz7 TaxID=3344873 RepID=UPI0035CBB678
MFTIIRSGMLTTIQDLGRHGYQQYGVSVSGAMDTFAHRTANLLVGNDEQQATLEMTLIGPAILFENDTFISICGADLSPTIDNEPLPLWRPIFVRKGSKLSFGFCKNGCRAYLAIAGGIRVANVMGSRSTFLKARIGGVQGRAVQSGDQLSSYSPSPYITKLIERFTCMTTKNHLPVKWHISYECIPHFNKKHTVFVMKGKHFSQFTRDSQEHFFTKPFTISMNSDRIGYRLKGTPLSLAEPKEYLSEPVIFGSIQVPTNGRPILLMADHPTTGGYPRIGEVASVDLPLIAQLKPGDVLSFQEISVQQAQRLLLEREAMIGVLKQGIKLALKRAGNT